MDKHWCTRVYRKLSGLSR